MKALPAIDTDTVSLEVYECNCGYHFTFDATYLDQVGSAGFRCSSCLSNWFLDVSKDNIELTVDDWSDNASQFARLP